MLFIVGLIMAMAISFVIMAAFELPVMVLSGLGLLTVVQHAALALAVIPAVLSLRFFVIRDGGFLNPNDALARAFVTYMKVGAGLGLVLSWIAALGVMSWLGVPHVDGTSATNHWTIGLGVLGVAVSVALFFLPAVLERRQADTGAPDITENHPPKPEQRKD